MFRRFLTSNILWALLPVAGLSVVMTSYKFLGGIHIFQILMLVTLTSAIGHFVCYKFISQREPTVTLNNRFLYFLIPLAGILNAIVYGLNFLMSENGGNLSIAFPILMTGVIVFSVLIGVLLFKEKLSLKNISGLALILLGIFFVYV